MSLCALIEDTEGKWCVCVCDSDITHRLGQWHRLCWPTVTIDDGFANMGTDWLWVSHKQNQPIVGVAQTALAIWMWHKQH
jgi:hypothetical protein